MSTKIFVHVPRKIKPPKPPDPALEAQIMREREAAEARKARHAEMRRAQAERRRQELAAKPAPAAPGRPPPTAMTPAQLGRWAEEPSLRILIGNNKWMKRLKNVATIHEGKIQSTTFAHIHDELTVQVVRAAEAAGQQCGADAVEAIARECALTVAGVAQEFHDLIHEQDERDAKRRSAGNGAAGGQEEGRSIYLPQRRAAKLA